MELWVKTSATDDSFMSWGQDASMKKWIFRNDGSGYLRVEINGGSRSTSGAMNNNTWRHVATTYAGADFGGSNSISTGTKYPIPVQTHMRILVTTSMYASETIIPTVG